MKIVFTSQGNNWESKIDSRFGRTDFIVLFDDETKDFQAIDNTAINNEAHGAGTATAQKVYELKPDVIITGNGPGENAANALKHSNVKIFVNAHDMTLIQAYNQYLEGKLSEL